MPLHIRIYLPCGARDRAPVGVLPTKITDVQRELVQEHEVSLARVRRGAVFTVPHPASHVLLAVQRLERHGQPRGRDGVDLAVRGHLAVAERAGADVENFAAQHRARAAQDMGGQAGRLKHPNTNHGGAHEHAQQAPQVELVPAVVRGEQQTCCGISRKSMASGELELQGGANVHHLFGKAREATNTIPKARRKGAGACMPLA
mmetsp:Transcript_59348/g.152832  ORF Transcript_59348/g.152832 Transcript_59348/m.152832 type:complete len:203 (+) Transcript_59348:275-883(+)